MAKVQQYPDRVSDVAEWGDNKVEFKLFRDMSAEELAEAKKIAQEIGPLPHQVRQGEANAD